MLNALLRFGFVHGAFSFFRALGADGRSLLAFFFLQLLAAQQLDECRVGAVAFSPASANDAQVSAFPIAEAWGYGIEKRVTASSVIK